MGRLPEDVKQICVWLARGYDRRLAKTQAVQRAGGRSAARRLAREQERLEAVEQALVAATGGIEADEIREKLRQAIMLNVESGHRYPYEQLGIDGISRSDFYRRKTQFLQGIAARLGLM